MARKYQVVVRIVKDVDGAWIDEEMAFGPCPNEEGAAAVLAAVAGREDVVAARIEPIEVELPPGEEPPPPPGPGRRPY